MKDDGAVGVQTHRDDVIQEQRQGVPEQGAVLDSFGRILLTCTARELQCFVAMFRNKLGC